MSIYTSAMKGFVINPYTKTLNTNQGDSNNSNSGSSGERIYDDRMAAIERFENRNNPDHEFKYYYTDNNANRFRNSATWKEDSVRLHTEERGTLDRIFGLLGYNGIVEALYNVTDNDESTTFGQGLREGFRNMNPFEDDVTQRNTFSDVLENLGWEDREDGKMNIGRGVVGFVGDVLLDPLTFLNPYASAGKILKGTGVAIEDLDKVRKAVKAAEVSGKINNGVDIGSKINKLADVSLDDAKAIINNNAPHLTNEEVEREAVRLTERFARDVKGYKDVGQGEDFKFGLGNLLPRSNVLTKSIITAETLQKIGDNTVAPYWNSFVKKLRTSRIASKFSNNNSIARIAKQEGDKKAFKTFVLNDLIKGFEKAEQNLKDIDTAEIIKNFFNDNPDISEEQFILNHDKGVYKDTYHMKKIKAEALKKFSEEIDQNTELAQKYMNAALNLEEEAEMYQDIIDKVYVSAVDEVAKKKYTNADELIKKRQQQRQDILNNVADPNAKEIDFDNDFNNYEIDEIVSSLQKTFDSIDLIKKYNAKELQEKFTLLKIMQHMFEYFENQRASVSGDLQNKATEFQKFIKENATYERHRNDLINLDLEINDYEKAYKELHDATYEEIDELLKLNELFKLEDTKKFLDEVIAGDSEKLQKVFNRLYSYGNTDDLSKKNIQKNIEILQNESLSKKNLYDEDTILEMYKSVDNILSKHSNEISIRYDTPIDKLTSSQKRESYELFSKLEMYSLDGEINWNNVYNDYLNFKENYVDTKNPVSVEDYIAYKEDLAVNKHPVQKTNFYGVARAVMEKMNKNGFVTQDISKNKFLSISEEDMKNFIEYLDLRTYALFDNIAVEKMSEVLGEFNNIPIEKLKYMNEAEFNSLYEKMSMVQKITFISKLTDEIKSGRLNNNFVTRMARDTDIMVKYIQHSFKTLGLSDDEIKYIRDVGKIIDEITNGELSNMQVAFQAIRDKHFDKTTSEEIVQYFEDHIIKMIDKSKDMESFLSYLKDSYKDLANDDGVISLAKYLFNQKRIKELPAEIKQKQDEFMAVAEQYSTTRSEEYIKKMDDLRHIVVDDVQELIEVRDEINYLKSVILKKIDNNINELIKSKEDYKNLVKRDKDAELDFEISKIDAFEALQQINQQHQKATRMAGQYTLEDIELYGGKELREVLNITNEAFDKALELEADEATFEIHKIVADRMTKAYMNELSLGLKNDGAATLDKKYVKRILSDEAAKYLTEPLLYEVGKFNGNLGIKDRHNKTRKFITMEEGEAWYAGFVRDIEFEKLIESGMSNQAAEAYLELYFDSDEHRKLYKYVMSEIFLQRAIGSNELIYTTRIHNFVKNKLCTVYEGTPTKDRVVANYIDITKSMRKFYFDNYGDFATAKEFKTFEKRVYEEAGLNYKLIGNNSSYFDITESQKKILDKYCDEKAKVQMYNMDDYIFNTVNTYTKDQMDSMQSGFMKLADKMLNHWKLLNTVVNPGFHIQNAFSNAFQSFLGVGADAFNPAKIKRAYAVLSTKDPKQFLTLNGKKYSYKQLADIIKEYKVVDNTFFKEEMSAGMYEFLPYKAGAKVGSAIEGTQRVNLFLSLLDQGKSYEEAVEGVNKFLFDYSELTEFEKGTMRRILPFYTFMRKNVPLMLEQMFLEQPNTFNTLDKAFTNIEKMNEDYVDENHRNPFRQDYIQLPFNIEGQSYGIANQLPYNQLERVLDINKLAGQMNPLIKTPFEIIKGKSFYTGMELGSPLDYLMQQIPASKIPYNAFKSKEKGTERELYIASQLAGFPINDISPMEYYEPYGDFWEDMYK